MTKAKSTARKPIAAKKPAAASAEAATTPQGGEPAEKELQEASGAEAKPEGAAAAAGGAEAKASEAKGAGAVDPAGTDGAPAAQSEQSREQAEAASADRKDAAEEENQPETTAQPPVAGPVLVVTGPKRGFWRAGLKFDRTPRTLSPDDLGRDIEGVRRFLAIVREPRLNVVLKLPDGTLAPLDASDLSDLEKASSQGSADSEEAEAILAHVLG